MELNGNPMLLQQGDASRTPLFLIHDSSGAVFNYFKLEPLGRPVYVIYNPWFRNTEKWEGGTMLFVNKYIELIKSVKHRGDILVGGWSLGGQLGIDIGRVLAKDKRSRLRVSGVVMVDTLYPYWGPPETVHADLSADVVLGACPPDMREEMVRCMKWTKEDCHDWTLRNWKENKDQLDGIEAEEPPPTVFIHATEYIPLGDLETGAVAMFDQFRKAKNGWDFFPHQNFMVAVWEIPTHHFGLFEKGIVR
ncbi:hypothetical protein EJ04DRAFT_444523 [Polyplosphaeria fusca]|uniref:Thioesterase domain-containing protein n=1 Tax=Polyplosphaeria fusca TaxID=682080 RepID=A0A9P4QNI2_9PLEO|nr:hypothetical protein EJ04DRAFT_444523 [Polyplosphaeria fusca]